MIDCAYCVAGGAGCQFEFTFADTREKAKQLGENFGLAARGRKTSCLASLAAGDEGQLERTVAVVEDAFELGVEVAEDLTTAAGTASLGNGLSSAVVGFAGKKGLAKGARAGDLVDDAARAGSNVPRGATIGGTRFSKGVPAFLADPITSIKMLPLS